MNFSMKRWAAVVTVAVVLGAAMGAQNTEAAFAKVGEAFIETLPSLGARQNVEPQSWIGYLWVPNAGAAVDPERAADDNGGGTIGSLAYTTFRERPEGRGPHFTVGFTMGVAKFDWGKINDGLELAKIQPVNIPSIPLPLIAGDLRLGGVVLPFDLGFSFMSLDLSPLLGSTAFFKYSNFGVDARYLILEEQGKIPNVSVGVGYNQVGLEAGFGGDEAEQTVTAKYDVAVDLKSDAFFLSAQTDKTWRRFSVFGGLKVLFDTTTVKGGFNISVNEATSGQSTSGSGGYKTGGDMKVRPLFNGGIAWRLGVIETVLGASIDATSGVWGANYTLRVKI
jgi:hypothetical protein